MLDQRDNVRAPQSRTDVNAAVFQVSDAIVFYLVHAIRILIQYRQWVGTYSSSVHSLSASGL